MKLIGFGVVVGLLMSQPVVAVTLAELHRQAVINDPALSGAEAQIDASGERVKEARAALLPTLSVNGQANRSRYTRNAANAFSNNSSNNTFTSRQFSEQLNQPLYKPGLWTALKQSHVMVDAATAQRDVAYADLTQRFSRAYFDVLIAQWELSQFQAQQKATQAQFIVAKRSFEIGTVSITDEKEAEAKADSIASQEATAAFDLESKTAMLDEIVGTHITVNEQHSLVDSLPRLEVSQRENWLQVTAANNPQIIQARLNLDAARLETSKARASYYPTLEFSVSQQNNYNTRQSISSPSDSGRSLQGGLTLTIPIYEGGGDSAKIREDRALERKAEYDLVATQRTAAQAVRQAFFATLSATAEYKGMETAERSADLALKANQRGYEVGMRINADVLDAQSKLFQARRDKRRAWYEAWANYTKLKTAAGVFSMDDLIQIDTLLSTSDTPEERARIQGRSGLSSTAGAQLVHPPKLTKSPVPSSNLK
jgi:outer membrane protein